MSGYSKTIKSGDYLEVFKYETKPPPTTHRKPSRKAPDSLTARDSVSRRLGNLKESRRRFRRLVRANLRANDCPAFLTLTMLEIVSVEVGSQCLNAFFKILRTDFGSCIRYIGVPEFQRRGALHYHILVWGIPDDYVLNERRTRYLQACWGQGYLDIIPTDGSPKLITYLAKYMLKAVADERLAGKRAYHCSRNVERETIFFDTPVHLFIKETLGVDNLLIAERSYDTVSMGRCDYKLIQLLL